MQNARAKGLSVLFKKENALRFSYSKPFGLITAVSDGVNYIRPSDINALFSRVSAALAIGGRFVFDMSTEYKLKNVIGNNVFYEDGEDLTYYWRNTYKEKDASVKMELTFFERREDGAYIRKDEEHKQYVHTVQEIKILAKGYGFTLDKTMDLDSLGDVHSKSKRILFVMTKAE